MKTQVYTTAAGEKAIVNFLTETFGTKDQAPVYSLGFQRMQKLSRKQQSAAFTALYLQGFTEIPANNTELKRRLESMTEQEFKAFKKNV